MSHPNAKSSDELIVMPVDDELLIYDQTHAKGHSLNPTAAFIWQHCDGETSSTELAAMLEENFDTSEGEKLTSMTLERLQKANLLTNHVAASNSISRRDMLQLAGRAGMAVALLPVVSSIIAPTPAQAQSSSPCPGPNFEIGTVGPGGVGGGFDFELSGGGQAACNSACKTAGYAQGVFNGSVPPAGPPTATKCICICTDPK